MNSQTWHILKQTELYQKFLNDTSIVKIELEFKFDDYKVDLYAKNNKGKIIIIEIGQIAKGKHNRLKRLSRMHEIEYRHIPFPKMYMYHKRKRLKTAKFSH